MMTMLQSLLPSRKPVVVPKTDSQKLEECLKLLKQLADDIDDLREELKNDNWREEKKELKEEVKSHTAFIHNITMMLVDNKKTNDSKPSALELYQQRKAAEATAEAAKPNGARKLPG